VGRVVSVQNTHPSAKAGVMIRETLNNNAMEAAMFVTPSNGIIAQARVSTGGSTVSTNAVGLTAPYWLKGVRNGKSFSAYYSPNGTTWTLIAWQNINMANNVYMGLAVTSHTNGILCTATLDNVTAKP
jgi:hypothetical protein